MNLFDSEADCCPPNWNLWEENHRISCVEKDHNHHLVSTPCYVQGHMGIQMGWWGQRVPGALGREALRSG